MPVHYRKRMVPVIEESSSLVDRGLAFLRSMIDVKVKEAEEHVRRRLKREERKFFGREE